MALKQWTNICEKPPTEFEKYFDKDQKNKETSRKQASFDNAFKKKMNRITQG